MAKKINTARQAIAAMIAYDSRIRSVSAHPIVWSFKHDHNEVRKPFVTKYNVGIHYLASYSGMKTCDTAEADTWEEAIELVLNRFHLSMGEE